MPAHPCRALPSPLTLHLRLPRLPALPVAAGHSRLLALQRMLSLADVEEARVKLAALELRNPLMGTSALVQALQVGMFAWLGGWLMAGWVPVGSTPRGLSPLCTELHCFARDP